MLVGEFTESSWESSSQVEEDLRSSSAKLRPKARSFCLMRLEPMSEDFTA
jgi:hypothetical protein